MGLAERVHVRRVFVRACNQGDTAVPQLVAVALAAEFVGFFKRHRLSTGEVQPIPIVPVMTIETPTVLFVMLQDNFVVHGENASGAVDFHLRVVAGGALSLGEDGVDVCVSSAVYSDREAFTTANMAGFRKTIDVSLWGRFTRCGPAATG